MQVEPQLPLGLVETPEQTFWRVYSEIRIKSRRSLPVSRISFRWKPYASSIGVVRIREGNLAVALSEALRDAPPEVIEALAEILVSKLFRRKVSEEFRGIYRRWLNDHATRHNLDERRRRRGRKLLAAPRGDYYDLVEIFETVNRRYFDGRVDQPALGWSRRASRTHLGHWDPTHRAIVLSPFLDRREVPRNAVEFVMYHEVLHILHPVEHTDGRRRVHTKAFRAAEKGFERFEEVRAVLKALCAAHLEF